MLVQTYFPNKMAPSRYDNYLASGWFRGSVMLYKMDLLCLEEDIFSVVNIRLNLHDHQMKKRHRKLFRKNNQKYKVRIRRAHITPRKEELYHTQKHKFKGFIHNTLGDFLHAGFMDTVFDTYEVEVFDGNKLVAVSFFDVGERSVASLLCLYDETYQKNSLGIFTMLHEVEYGKRNHISWYYPGYILDQPSSFDYKLCLGEYEYYSANRRWNSYAHFQPEETLGNHLKLKIEELSQALQERGVEFTPYLYPYFSMGYMGYWYVNFVKFPVFILVESKGDEQVIIGYSTDDKEFSVLSTQYAIDFQYLINIEMSREFEFSDTYYKQLIKIKKLLLACENTGPIVDHVKTMQLNSFA